MMVEIGEAVFIAGATGLTSAIASWAAMRVTLTYMKRDITRAQSTGDRANERIDGILGFTRNRPLGPRETDLLAPETTL